MYNCETQTKPLLAVVGDEVACICMLCGRMYTERPLLCLCESNVFLEDLEEPEVLTLELQQMVEMIQEQAEQAQRLSRAPGRAR